MARPNSIRREDILDAARPIFFKNGIAATEMKDIARRCGIGRSSLYRYFESKEALALVLAAETLELVMAPLDAGLATPGNGYRRAEAGLTAFTQSLRRQADKVRFLDDFDRYFTDSYPNNTAAAAYTGTTKGGLGPLEEVLRAGMADGSIRPLKDPAFTALLQINTLLGVAQRVLPRAGLLRAEQGYAEEYLDATLALLLADLRPQ